MFFPCHIYSSHTLFGHLLSDVDNFFFSVFFILYPLTPYICIKQSTRLEFLSNLFIEESDFYFIFQQCIAKSKDILSQYIEFSG